jgi:hypothetical protein
MLFHYRETFLKFTTLDVLGSAARVSQKIATKRAGEGGAYRISFSPAFTEEWRLSQMLPSKPAVAQCRL